MRQIYTVLVKKCERRRPHGRPCHKSGGNIKNGSYRKYDGTVWTGFIWGMRGNNGALL
jgi:hypothetical protein